MIRLIPGTLAAVILFALLGFVLGASLVHDGAPVAGTVLMLSGVVLSLLNLRSWHVRVRAEVLALRSRLERAEAQAAELRAEVQEWLCGACNTVYPGPPQHGFSCVICPKCSGTTGPRVTMDKRKLEAQLAANNPSSRDGELSIVMSMRDGDTLFSAGRHVLPDTMRGFANGAIDHVHMEVDRVFQDLQAHIDAYRSGS